MQKMLQSIVLFPSCFMVFAGQLTLAITVFNNNFGDVLTDLVNYVFPLATYLTHLVMSQTQLILSMALLLWASIM
jgi:hypothetical protein